MWWNYKKPKPLKIGAYKIAARNNVPILPIFITMEDSNVMGEDGFYVQEYTVNIGKPIFPDENLTEKENLEIMKEKNAKVWKEIYETVFDALCHYSDNRATIVLGFLVRAFKVGQRIMEHMTDKYVMEVFELSRKVNKEADKIRGFIRFSDNGNYLLAHFEPKCDMIPVVMWHFVDRYPGENFVIYDDRRRYAVVHPRLKECFYINESEFKQLERSVPVKTDSFEQLWKVYFEHTDIRERFNPQCQRNLCPKWYRKNMVEFT